MNGLQKIMIIRNVYLSRQILKHKKLRKIDKSEWKFESDLDENGFKKVTEMSGFNGVFVDSSGKTYDLRPQENKPSYNNFIKKVINIYTGGKNYLRVINKSNSKSD